MSHTSLRYTLRYTYEMRDQLFRVTVFISLYECKVIFNAGEPIMGPDWNVTCLFIVSNIKCIIMEIGI